MFNLILSGPIVCYVAFLPLKYTIWLECKTITFENLLRWKNKQTHICLPIIIFHIPHLKPVVFQAWNLKSTENRYFHAI